MPSRPSSDFLLLRVAGFGGRPKATPLNGFGIMTRSFSRNTVNRPCRVSRDYLLGSLDPGTSDRLPWTSCSSQGHTCSSYGCFWLISLLHRTSPAHMPFIWPMRPRLTPHCGLAARVVVDKRNSNRPSASKHREFSNNRDLRRSPDSRPAYTRHGLG